MQKSEFSSENAVGSRLGLSADEAGSNTNLAVQHLSCGMGAGYSLPVLCDLSAVPSGTAQADSTQTGQL